METDHEPAVIPPDLGSPDEARVTVSIDRNDNPFTALDEKARMRLFIRVLCELVAYGEPTDDLPVGPRVRPAPSHRQQRTTART